MPPLEFSALEIVNEHRSAHGLRSNDFVRYRKHCANRAHRLRSTLKITHGRGREFKKLPVLKPDLVIGKHLQLLLFESERAWAHSQDLSEEISNPNGNLKVSTLRHRATGRFRRCIHWATQLLSLCQSMNRSRLSAVSLLEVSIYVLMMNGRFLRYKDDFESAFAQLVVARSLLDELAASAVNSRDQALATFFSDELGPELRYCAHELGRERAYDVESLVRELAPRYRAEFVENCEALVSEMRKESSGSSHGKQLDSVIWEGQPVPIRHPELIDAFLKIQQADTRLTSASKDLKSMKSRNQVSKYDDILLALSEAEDVARRLADATKLSARGDIADQRTSGRDIHFVLSFILLRLLSQRILRDSALMTALLASSEPAKQTPMLPSDVVRSIFIRGELDDRLLPAVVKLLETITQNLTQMRTLSMVDESPDLIAAIEARIAFVDAQRSVCMARGFAQIKRFPEAVALTQSATLQCREAQSHTQLATLSEAASFFPLDSAILSRFQETLSEGELHFKNQWFLLGGAPDVPTNSKPLFFNIASNYLHGPFEKVQERAGKATLKQRNDKVEAKAPEINPAEPARSSPSLSPPPQGESKGAIGSLLNWWGRK